MRELEFLPGWYHQARHRRRMVALQAYILILLVAGLGTWLGLARRNVRAAETSLGEIRAQLNQSQAEQKQLELQLLMKKELQTREALVASLGYPVEMTRLLQTLDGIMPKEMSLIEVACATEEQEYPGSGVSVARALAGSERGRPMNRRLGVRLVGVAPSDVDLANFVGAMTNLAFLEQVALGYSRDKVDDGHVMREFEVTFSIDLNQAPEN